MDWLVPHNEFNVISDINLSLNHGRAAFHFHLLLILQKEKNLYKKSIFKTLLVKELKHFQNIISRMKNTLYL